MARTMHVSRPAKKFQPPLKARAQPMPGPVPAAESEVPEASTIPPPATAKRPKQPGAVQVELKAKKLNQAKSTSSRKGGDKQPGSGEAGSQAGPSQQSQSPTKSGSSTVPSPIKINSKKKSGRRFTHDDGQADTPERPAPANSSTHIRHSASTSSPADRSPTKPVQAKRGLSEHPDLQAVAQPSPKKRLKPVARKSTGGRSPRAALANRPTSVKTQSSPSPATKAEPEPSSSSESSSTDESADALASQRSQAADTWHRIPPATLAALGEDDLSASLTKIKVQRGGESSLLRVGEVHAIAQAPLNEISFSQQEAKPWFGVVRDIRGLANEKVPAGQADGNGRVHYSYINLYARVDWLYDKDNFKDLPRSHRHSRWKGALDVMGTNERVETSHDEWLRFGRVEADEVNALRFDDRYPAAPVPGMDSAFQAATHPLTALGPGALTGLPNYLFGDESRAQSETDGADGKWSGVPWVRTRFDFTAHEEGVAQDEGDDGDEGGGARGAKKKGRKAKAKPKQPKSTKLEFNEHYRDQPYDPAAVQHFSPALQQWCNVADLKSRKQKRKQALVKYDKDDNPATTAADRNETILAVLDSLASQSIVRGGAFGLTGNAFLVTRAAEIRDKLVKLDGQTTKKSKVKGLMVEAEGLVLSAGEWAAEVKRRKGDGMEVGEAAKGEVWVCPSDGKTEI